MSRLGINQTQGAGDLASRDKFWVKMLKYKPLYNTLFNASDNLRISTSHETNGQAYLALRIYLSKPLYVLCSLSTK